MQTEAYDVIDSGPGLAGRAKMTEGQDRYSWPGNTGLSGDVLNGAQLAKAAELAHKKVTETLNNFHVRQWCIEQANKHPGKPAEIIAIAQAYYDFLAKAVEITA